MAITPLPEAPNRTDGHETFVEKANAWVAALDLWTTEANSLAVDVNADEAAAAASAEAASTSETNASNSADVSAANANFEGAWSAGTYTLPSSVYHDSKIWILIAASTTGTPGISADWVEHEVGPNKNLLINPEGLVNQEGYVDGAATTESQHIFDMWGVDRITAGNCLKVTRLNKTIQLDNNVTGAVTSWMEQQNDDIHAVPDGDYMTVSGEITAITGGNFSVRGLGCSKAFTTTGKFSETFIKDTTQTIPITDNPEIRFIVEAGQSVIIKNLKLEEGTVATKYSTPKISDNWDRCLYYYERITADGNILVPLADGFVKTTANAVGKLGYSKKRLSSPSVSSTTLLLVTPSGTYSGTMSFSPTGSTISIWVMTGTGYPSAEPCYLVLNSGSDYIEVDARYAI